jgi:hypothetical protein
MNNNPDEMDDTIWAVDLWPDEKKLITIACTPLLAFQEDGYSNIEQKNKSFDNWCRVSEKIISSIKNNIPC